MNKIILIFLTLMFLNSCASNENNRLLGQLIGAGAGAVVGNQIGGGVGKLLATAAGAMIGTYIATEVVDYLSVKEQKEFSELTISALDNAEDNETQSWTSSENINTKGEVEVTKSFMQEKKNCRTIKQKISTDDKDIIKSINMCRNSEGNWEKV